MSVHASCFAAQTVVGWPGQEAPIGGEGLAAGGTGAGGGGTGYGVGWVRAGQCGTQAVLEGRGGAKLSTPGNRNLNVSMGRTGPPDLPHPVTDIRAICS